MILHFGERVYCTCRRDVNLNILRHNLGCRVLSRRMLRRKMEFRFRSQF